MENRLPVLYIDVDGVIIAWFDGHWQLRPGAGTFLRWCVQNFSCKWLTCHPKISTDRIVDKLEDPALRKIEYQEWQTAGHGNKTEGVNLGGDFYWVEDGLCGAEFLRLSQADKLDRYIFVSPVGAYELKRVKQQLERKLSAQATRNLGKRRSAQQ